MHIHPRNLIPYQVLSQLMDRFKKCSYNEEVSDLYAMNFLSDMTETEYEREGLTKVLPLAEDVILEQNKIERVDCILFLYPV